MMNDRCPAASLVIDSLGKAIDGGKIAHGCPDTLSALGLGISRKAAKLAHLCDLGTLDAIELHMRDSPPVIIEPAAEGGLLLRG